MAEDMEDMDAALAEIIDLNDFLPAGDEDADAELLEENQGNEQDDAANDERAFLAQQEALRVALQANFRALRDTYFEHDLDACLEPRPTQNTVDAFDIELADDPQQLRQAYRPKDGDYKNLQLFAERLAVSFVEPQLELLSVFSIYLFLHLPNGSMALLEFTPLGPACPLKNYEIYLNGVFMHDLGLALQVVDLCRDHDAYLFGSVSAQIFVPQAPMEHTERHADCDTVLDFITSQTWRSQGCYLSIHASGHEQVDDFFSAFNLQASLERCRNGEVHLGGMHLTEDMWRGLSIIECKKLVVDNMLLPRLLWHQTQAKEIQVSKNLLWSPSVGEREIEYALSGLQSRATPIDTVHFSGHVDLRSLEDAEKWASALTRVRRFEVWKVQATMTAWTSFWLSMAMATNVSLVSFRIEKLLITDFLDDLSDGLPQPLSVIRGCLQRNLFLELISIPLMFKNQRHCNTFKNHRHWNNHVVPLLEMNRRHEHRLTPDETRESVIHYRLLQIHTNPKKLFKILKDYRRFIIPPSKSEHQSDSEHGEADEMDTESVSL